MTVFVGCPEGCRYNTASAVYDLASSINLLTKKINAQSASLCSLVAACREHSAAANAASKGPTHCFCVDCISIVDWNKCSSFFGGGGLTLNL